GSHRQGLDSRKEERAIVVVERLCQPQRPAKLKKTQEPPCSARTRIGLVLCVGCGVLPPRERGIGLGVAIDVESADHQKQEGLSCDDPEEDLGRRRTLQLLQEGSHKEGIRGHLLANGNLLDHVIDEKLDRPGQNEQGEEAEDREANFHREAKLERGDVTQGAAKQQYSLAVCDSPSCLLLHWLPPSVPAGNSSSSRSRR